MNDGHADRLECLAVQNRVMSLAKRQTNRDTDAGGARFQMARVKMVGRTVSVNPKTGI